MKPLLSSVVVFTLSVGATSVLARNSVSARIQAGKSAADGVYTEAQSARGQALYDKTCASCHGDKLDGTAMAPTLSGQDFVSGWADRTAADLNEKIQTTMPADAAGTLTPQQTVDLIAYVLKVSKYPAGSTELAAGAGLADISLKAR
jgi:mono/diheme cytochrome c family protein